MIVDSSAIEAGSQIEADLCIVGAGAAGIALALQFVSERTRIVLLESGGNREDPATQKLYDGDVADGSRHLAPIQYRRRQFGGSTNLWGGRCIPFDPIDFETRDWVPHSGWPIGYEEVARYYPAASRLCETGDFDYAARADWPELLAGFAGQDFSADTIERFSCPTNFAARYRVRLAAAANIRVILHANAVSIATAHDGNVVQAVDVRSLNGHGFRVRASRFVLATGGLETPRLLLASRDHHANGLGNAHDQVGRYYMCHVAGTLGALRARVPVHYGYTISPEGVYCRRRLALRPAAQRRLRVGNLVARLHHPRIADPAHGSGILSALYAAAPFITPEYAIRLKSGVPPSFATRLRHAGNIAAAPGEVARFLLHWARHRTLAERKFPSIVAPPRNGIYTLDVHAEQAPNPCSRITLGSTPDALGMPRLRVDWRHLPADIETVRVSLRALAADLEASGTASLAYDEDEVEEAMLRDGAYGGHHIGTARMSADPRFGVVDGRCRVHGVGNLWIAGSAVFPTSGQANPTLTIVALAVRLKEDVLS